MIHRNERKRTLKENHRCLNPFAENFCESVDIRTKVGEFRNKDAISLEPSDLCQMFSTTFNTDYKNKDSTNQEQGQLLHRAIKIRTCFLLQHARGHFYLLSSK